MSLLTSVLVVASMPVMAGSIAAPEEHSSVVAPTAPQVDWSGFYLGGQIGTSDLKDDTNDLNGKFGGIHAGYNFSIENYVVGVEFDYDFNKYDDSGLDLDADFARLKLRAGYSFGRTMAYGVVGASHVNPDGGDSENGYNLGLGINYLATDNIVIGAEYLRDMYDLNGDDVDGNNFSVRISYKF